MSSHVVVENLAAGDQILHDLNRLLHERFGIEHTTLQLESEPLVQIAPQTDAPSSPGSAGRSCSGRWREEATRRSPLRSA
jgi:hypothetical protein